MIEQTWWNTPWYRISIYLTNGRALRLGIIVLAWIGFLVFIGYAFGKQGGRKKT